MKIEAFLGVLRPYAAIIAAQGNARLAAQINALDDTWAPIMSWNVKDLLRRAWPAESLPEVDEASVEELRTALIRLQSVIKTVAKQDVVKDLSAVIGALEPHDREDLDAFIRACRSALEAANTAKPKSSKASAPAKPLDESRVAEIVQQLREAYKDTARFVPLFERLSADKTFTQADMAAIATLFAYKTSSKTGRTESLQRIWFVHESYTTSAAKSNFSGGKSAA
jgi:hypothetical protein